MEQTPLRDSRNCPDCDARLEYGYIVGSNILWWTKKEPSFSITEKGGNIKLARKLWGWGWARIKGKKCPNCNLIIIRQNE